MAMKCKQCSGELEIQRQCRRIRMRCVKCKREFQIHEIAGELDSETEKLLENYTVIIYD